MTVATAVNRTVVTGNGSATTFAYTFPIISSSHLVVIRSTSAGVDTTLTLGTHYSVSGVGSASGGTITYPLTGSALPAGDRLIMLRSVPLTQLTDLTNQGAFYAETHETTFDLHTMADQQLSERLDRAVTVPPSDSGSLVLPNAVSRAGRYLTFDGSGNATTSATAEVSGSLMAMERTGDGSTTVWTLPAVLTGGARSLIVSVDGVVQPVSSYTVASDQLTFGEAPPLNAAIDVRVIGAPVVVSLADDTQITATGSTTARTLAARFADPFNARDFGAAGVNGVDYTAALQAAITAAEAVNGTVYIPPGTYYITGLTVAAPIRIVGAGKRSTIIYLKNASNASCFTIAALAQGTNGEWNHVGFESLTIIGNRGNNTSGHGIDLTTLGSGYGCGVVCRDVEVNGCIGAGINIGNRRNAGVLDNTTISYCTGGGLVIGSAGDWICSDSLFGGCGNMATHSGDGVTMIGSFNMMFHGCSAFSNAAYGVRVEPFASTFYWYGGSVDRNQQHGFSIEGDAVVTGRAGLIDGTVLTLNSAQTTGTYSDIKVTNYVSRLQIRGVRHAYNAANQAKYGVEFAGTCGVVHYSGSYDLTGTSAFATAFTSDFTKIVYTGDSGAAIGPYSGAGTISTVIAGVEAVRTDSTRHRILKRFELEGTTPTLFFRESDASADWRLWRVDADSNRFRGFAVNDAESSTGQWLEVQRSAASIIKVAFYMGGAEWLRVDGTGQIVHRANATVLADASSHLGLRSYTVATLPSASTAARLIYVSDGTSDKRLAVSDGTNWRFPDGAIVS